jgi:hypothetical protein
MSLKTGGRYSVKNISLLFDIKKIIVNLQPEIKMFKNKKL